ncbi:hypothetical protein D3C81_1713930 [compost metagenome]
MLPAVPSRTMEFTANPRAVPFMPYGAFFEPHAAPSSHLIVRKSSLPRSQIFTYSHQGCGGIHKSYIECINTP